MQLGWIVEPLAGITCMDVLSGEGEVTGHTDACGRLQLGCEEGEELIVAVRGFDEDLGLVLAIDALFHGLEKLFAWGTFYWQIAEEGEILSIEA